MKDRWPVAAQTQLPGGRSTSPRHGVPVLMIGMIVGVEREREQQQGKSNSTRGDRRWGAQTRGR